MKSVLQLLDLPNEDPDQPESARDGRHDDVECEVPESVSLHGVFLSVWVVASIIPLVIFATFFQNFHPGNF